MTEWLCLRLFQTVTFFTPPPVSVYTGLGLLLWLSIHFVLSRIMQDKLIYMLMITRQGKNGNLLKLLLLRHY